MGLQTPSFDFFGSVNIFFPSVQYPELYFARNVGLNRVCYSSILKLDGDATIFVNRIPLLSSKIDDRRKVALTADLMRRGATLLNETCPRCGGVQIKYQGKVYCINEDDLSNIGSPLSSAPISKAAESSSSEQTVQQTVLTSSTPHRAQPAPSSERDALKALLEEKLAKVSQQLENSQDYNQQEKLLDLISKYLETLEKLKNNKHGSGE